MQVGFSGLTYTQESGLHSKMTKLLKIGKMIIMLTMFIPTSINKCLNKGNANHAKVNSWEIVWGRGLQGILV